MDLLAALRHYAPVYRAHATQLATYRCARQWLQTMDYRSATREQLVAHARMAARWASAGYLAVEAAPLIASGMTVEQAVDADPTTDAERLQRLADRMAMLRGDD